ncbi:MAG: hypothetical protein AABX33_06895 [Nanoarchaeota archaeon]
MIPEETISIKVRQFAGSELASDFEGFLSRDKIDLAVLQFKGALAYHIAQYLKTYDSIDSKAVYQRLDTLIQRGASLQYDDGDGEASRKIDQGKRMCYLKFGGFDFYAIAIFYYAGLKLPTVVDKVIADGKAAALYDLCDAVKTRATEVLSVFKVGYDDYAQFLETTGGVEGVMARRLTTRQNAELLYDAVMNILPAYRQSVDGIVENMGTALQRMKSYVEQQ